MENQRPLKRRDEVADSSMDDDRISQLPQAILDHLLSFLSQEDAVRTCVLSKSWRHLGPTRTKFEFDQRNRVFSMQEKFLCVLNDTLQRYADQNHSIHEFILSICRNNRESVLFLNKWIPILILNMSVKAFSLSAHCFSLPSVVFEAQFLEELYLEGCKLDQINCIVKLRVLKRLSLSFVYINDETFEKIMSSCPLIEHLVLDLCRGLSIIKVNNARNLKHIGCFINKLSDSVGSIEINDAPSLETIHISNRQNLHHYFFLRLKSLKLWFVHLPAEFLNNLSSNCTCLEELELHFVSGSREFNISSRSIKRLIINIPDCPIRAAIDATNMLYFEFRSNYLPSISFATTSREWESHIHVGYYSDSKANISSTWSLELYELLKALNQSQISLDTSYLPLTKPDTYDGGSCEPVVVENFCLRGDDSPSAVPELLNSLFCICRPRYIRLPLYSNSRKMYQSQLAESIWKTLVKKGETSQCDLWQQDLEESSIQVLEENAQEWRPGQVCEFSNTQIIRFRLKWRDFQASLLG